MKAIGFNNFRKFENFPRIPMGNITIFVGGNNSGKSTTVKAIISVLSFLRSARFYASGNDKQFKNVNFYFNQNPYAHIGNFVRAKCNKNDNKEMSFEIQIENFNLKLYLNGEGCDNNATYAKVERIILIDTSSLFEFDINFKEDSIIFTFNKNTQVFENEEEYQSFIEKINKKEEKGYTTDRLKQAFYYKYPIIDETYVFKTTLSDIYKKRSMIGGPLISGIIFNTSYMFLEETKEQNDENKIIERNKILRNYMFRLSSNLDNLFWYNSLIEYIYAHSASQTILYNSTDNNYLSKTVHEFAELREDKDIAAFNFVRKWMKIFSIGQNFKLESIGGEAHTFDIIDFDDKCAPLADKGMGTIQLMILLLRIAIIIKNRDNSRRKKPVTVIVEEPELNLHPQKQSQLIEFFTNVSDEYKIKFIIETHSEYLVRRSQGIVASKKYKDQETLERECPYKVYYFPENDIPYKMNYRTDGKFSNKFGTGFFDEATRLSFDLF